MPSSVLSHTKPRRMVILDHLQDPVEGDHGPGPAHPGAAVDHDGPLLGAHTVPECPDKSGEKIFSMKKHT